MNCRAPNINQIGSIFFVFGPHDSWEFWVPRKIKSFVKFVQSKLVFLPCLCKVQFYLMIRSIKQWKPQVYFMITQFSRLYNWKNTSNGPLEFVPSINFSLKQPISIEAECQTIQYSFSKSLSCTQPHTQLCHLFRRYLRYLFPKP